jgi:cell pole-organizing protein PopZ
MTQAAKAQEPSMEEILASIRRIIADDDATKTTQRAPEPPRPEPPPIAPMTPPAPPVAAPPRSMEPERRFVPEPPPMMVSDAIAEQSSDILDLTESMAASPPPLPPAPPPMPESAPAFRTIDGTSDLGFDEAMEKLAPAPAFQPAEPSQLISSHTSAAVDSAFSALAQTVLVQNARTLEDLVREMLRPMLKNWLDDNLPGLVERLVRAEIERVSRGRAS